MRTILNYLMFVNYQIYKKTKIEVERYKMLEVTVDFLSIWMNSHKLSVIFLVITLDDYTDVETVAYARTMF
ncbi:hypothetical protein AA18895_0431 [Acetobacter ghanensis DSM 18895]|nr:hypothetical protein AA18895_0431 [Acetobacter ghanensis DSM 18895]